MDEIEKEYEILPLTRTHWELNAITGMPELREAREEPHTTLQRC
jgi:hypothetical protein